MPSKTFCLGLFWPSLYTLGSPFKSGIWKIAQDISRHDIERVAIVRVLGRGAWSHKNIFGNVQERGQRTIFWLRGERTGITSVA